MLAGAVFFLSFFLSMGLIVRTLGFTRSFGGAMIAFGLGIGIIYPLLITITYGYVDVSANVSCIQQLSCGGAQVLQAVSSIAYGDASFTSLAGTAIGNLVLYIGYIVTGLVVLPLLNLAIVDAFIIDFSTAVGEKMSFGQLFSDFL